MGMALLTICNVAVCGTCQKHKNPGDHLVLVGDGLDQDDMGLLMCKPCLVKALALITDAEAEQEKSDE